MRRATKTGKQKGSNYERKIAKILKAAWNIELVKTPISGGWGKMKTSGDITAEDRNFPFSIECKKQEGWSFEQLFKSPEKCELNKWWSQALDQGYKDDKIPLLIFSRNFQPNYIRFRMEDELITEFAEVCISDGVESPSTIMLLDEFLKVQKILV
jgi:hypothetical protein